MSPRDKAWAVAFVTGWALLVYGATAGDRSAIAAAAGLLLVFAVERWDNWARHRGGDER